MSRPAEQWLKDNAWSVLDAVVDAVITMDAKGCIHSVNRATLEQFGYEEAELVGQPIACLMPEPHRSQHQRYVQDFLATGQAKIIGIGRELLAQRRSGEVFPIYLAISELKAPDGTYFAGIIRDLSEQKAVQAALHEQRSHMANVDRLSIMGEMTASIAHEINQPLTAIAMYAQSCLKLISRAEVDLEMVANALTKLNEQSLRAGAVIERIQRFMRNEEGERQPIDLNQLVRGLERLAVGDARLRGIDLTLELHPSILQVSCDPVQIQQVALNLLRNGIDAMEEIGCRNGHRITVRTACDGATAEVSVTDAGDGVREADADKLFRAFHTTKANGMGMGLSICKSIMEEHEGDLGFRNLSPSGCCFYFRLPIDQTGGDS